MGEIVLLREKLDRKLVSLESAELSVSQELKFLRKERSKLAAVTEAQILLQEVAKSVQEQAHKRISRLVTKCLIMVFGPAYALTVDFEKKRSKTEARISIMNNREKLDPTDSSGGGVLDVASFALRLSCMSLQLPQSRKFVSLDEPFKHLSAGVPRHKVKALLELLSEELGMQFLISTHMKSLRTGTIIELS